MDDNVVDIVEDCSWCLLGIFVKVTELERVVKYLEGVQRVPGTQCNFYIYNFLLFSSLRG